MQGRACTLELINPEGHLSRENVLPHSAFEEFVGPVHTSSGQEITLEEKCKNALYVQEEICPVPFRSCFSPNLLNLKTLLIWWFCLITLHSSLINSSNNFKSFKEKTELGIDENLETHIRGAGSGQTRTIIARERERGKDGTSSLWEEENKKQRRSLGKAQQENFYQEKKPQSVGKTGREWRWQTGTGMRSWWSGAGAVCTDQLESWSCE